MNDSVSLPCASLMDSSFGPVVIGCRDDFDFTLAFEQYFFSIAPSVLLLFAAPFRLRFLAGKQKRIHGHTFKLIKLSVIALFAVVQLTLIILWSTQAQVGARGASIAAATVSFAVNIVLIALSYLEHSRSLRPSILLNAYLLISLVCDAVLLRTLWLQAPSTALCNLFTVSFIIKALILLFEAKEKRKYFNDDDKLRGPEEVSGLYSQSFFWWLNDMILHGFRHVLRPEDLYPVDESMTSEALEAAFWKTWNKATPSGKHRLMLVMLTLLKWPLFISMVPRLILIAFTFGQPFLVSRFLDYLQQRPGAQDANTGYGLVGACGLIYLGIAISSGFYWHRWCKCLTMLRGTLVTAIFTKTIEISNIALDNSAAVTLMSTDVERIVNGLRQMHELWASILQVILATWLLEREIGWACIAPVIVASVSAGITIWLSTLTKKRQGKWVTKIQERVGITSTMLGSMKEVKQSGLTQKLTEIISNLRVKEIASAKDFRLLGVYGSTLAYVPLMASPIITFAIFTAASVKDGTTLDATRLFTTLSLLLLLSQPLFMVFEGIGQFTSALACFERIQKYLAREPRIDMRTMVSEMSFETHRVDSASISSVQDGLELDSVRAVPCNQGASSDMINITNGAFGWNTKGNPVVKGIDLVVRRSSFTVLVGPVASGKSTILKAILGETPKSEGRIQVSTSSIAFCEQSPWITNTSIQNNITGFSLLESAFYKEVINSCDLEDEIALLQNGDQTKVGSKGITLSGGQKQRVALARALYAKKDLAIFDDIFSGLDASTERIILNRIFGPQGLLRRLRTTVVVATHAANFLPLADRVIVLDKNGRIEEQGSFQELKSSNGYVQKFYSLHTNDTKEGRPETSTGNDSTLGKQQAEIKAPLPGGKERQLGDWSVYNYYFKTLGFWYAFVFLVFQVLWGFFSTFPAVWLKWWADANEVEPNQMNGFYLGVYGVLQVAGLLTNAGLVWFCFNVMVMKSGKQLHNILLRTVMAAPMTFFSATDTGSIVTRFSQDIQLIDGNLPLALMCVVSYLFTAIGQAVLIASATFYVALCFPALIAVFYFIQRFYLRTSRQLRLLDLEEKSPVYSQFLETLNGLVTIRAFSWQKPSTEHNQRLVDRSQKPFYLLFMVQRWLPLVLDLVTTALAVIVVAVAVKLRDSVSATAVGVSLTQIISFAGLVKLVILSWTNLETSIAAVARIKQFETDTENENLPSERHDPPSDWPSKGQIEIRGVSATYNPGTESRELDGIDLFIEAGQKIGICGRTGSGKSTLLSTLTRLLPLTTGTITIDSHDLTLLPRSTLRSRLISLPQDPIFLPATARLNLDPYSTHPDTKLLNALTLVGLLPEIEARGGLDHILDAGTLSQGQKQLFCLARACLRVGDGGGVLLLDEISSSVDPQTDALMQRIIRDVFRRYTIIAVAHRLSTVVDFDKVAVMERGTVVEFDEPRKLMARASRFRTLYEAGSGRLEG